MKISHPTSVLISFAALAVMIIFYGLTTVGMMGPNPVGQTGNYVEPLIIPEGYAFSIWGLIYLGLLVFPVYQLFRKDRNSRDWIEIRLWYSANVVANGVWLVCASYNWLWLSVIVIIFMLVSLYQIRRLFVQLAKDSNKLNYWTEQLVFSMYFAWITLATVLNVSSALNYYNWNGFGISDEQWTLIMLTAAAAITISVFWKFRDIAFGLVVIWAYVAVIVRHWTDYPAIAYLCLAVVLVFITNIFLVARARAQFGS